MKGDIALAGFMLTAEEWQALDPLQRAQLLAVATQRDDPWAASGSTQIPGMESDETTR